MLVSTWWIVRYTDGTRTLVLLAVGADLVGLELEQALDGGLVLRGALGGGVGRSSRHVDVGARVDWSWMDGVEGVDDWRLLNLKMLAAAPVMPRCRSRGVEPVVRAGRLADCTLLVRTLLLMPELTAST